MNGARQESRLALGRFQPRAYLSMSLPFTPEFTGSNR